MNKYEDNRFVEIFDAIVILNDNYENIGIKKGYIGTVFDIYIEKMGIVLADFANPFTGETINAVAEIKLSDFKVISGSREDQLLVKKYKDLFR